jgi:hypothetical protein
MSVKISIGSMVSGKSGKPLKVLAVNGDVLEVSSDTGTFKVRRSAILKVIPPRPRSFKKGDRVEYIGAKTRYSHQYDGIMTVWQLGEGCDRDKCACLRVGGRDVTSWIEFEDLELTAIEVTPSLEGDLWA